MADQTPQPDPGIRDRPADLPLVLEDLLAQIEDNRAVGRPDANLVAEYVWLRERA